MPQPDLPAHHILQQAAQWFATMLDEDVRQQDRDQWQAWLNAHPEHQRAWHYVEQVGQRFQQAQQQAGTTGARQIIHDTRSSRITRRTLLGSGLASVATWLIWSQTTLPGTARQLAHTLSADYRTATGEQRQLTLSDGGQLWLNTATAVDISYTDTIRHIKLRDGEILIETAKDALARPFVVTTLQGSLRALGTRFSVQQRDANTQISVYEGAVEINATTGQRLTLQAGEQTSFTASAIAKPHKAQHSRVAWQQGLIVADNISLQELVEKLSRYRHGYLAVDASVANLKVMGTYPIDKPDHTLTMLENALPIRTRRVLPWWVTLEPDH
jgi:transmembrane sensor